MEAPSRIRFRLLGAVGLLIVVVVGATLTVRSNSSSPQPSVPGHVSAGPVDTPAVNSPDAKTVTVTTIPALLNALADDSVEVIIVSDGTYHVSPSNAAAGDSLWIGSRFADRTRPVLVRAETRGGVTFDGAGKSEFGGLSFEDGAHDQTWDGFTFANMAAGQTGIIEIGGYVPRRTPHHITLRNITIERSCTGRATTRSGRTWDQGIYVAHAAGNGPHDLLFEDISVDGRGGLASAIQFDHGDAASPAATKVTVRRLTVIGTQQAIILWLPTLHDITFDTVDITDALAFAVRFESIGATGIVFANITSTGSGCQGFYSSQGSDPPGVTFVDDHLDGPSDPTPDGCP